MTVWYTWMNFSVLLDPSYLSMCPALNFSDQITCLSGGARAQKPPLPDGVTSLTGERRGGVDDLALTHLWSSMMLQRSSRSRTHSRRWRFWVIRRHASLSARWRLPLANDVASLRTLFAQSFDWLSTDGSPRGLSADRCATTKFTASTPCRAIAIWEESSGAINWMNFMIVWSRMALKSGFRFQIILSLGVWVWTLLISWWWDISWSCCLKVLWPGPPWWWGGPPRRSPHRYFSRSQGSHQLNLDRGMMSIRMSLML
jgi:hypothetical protein